jgi:hypothetical protein
MQEQLITIEEFLSNVGIKVENNEPEHYTELMMDNHKCIQYGKKQYYLPETNMFGDDEILFDFLVEHYGL